MPKRSPIDPLDRQVEALLGRAGAGVPDPELAPFMNIARNLRELPREKFKARLKSQLERKSSMASASETSSALRQTATASLRIKYVGTALEFYQKAFGAREISRFEAGGQIPHA